MHRWRSMQITRVQSVSKRFRLNVRFCNSSVTRVTFFIKNAFQNGSKYHKLSALFANNLSINETHNINITNKSLVK